MLLAVAKLNLIETRHRMAQWGLSNPSAVPYCKILWEAHFTITTNCVKQWRQLIGRKLLSEPSDTFDCILSALQLLSSEDRKYELICKRTMAQSIKTAGSFARLAVRRLTGSLGRPSLPPVRNHNHGFTPHFPARSALSGRLTTSEAVDSSGSSGSGIDEISHSGRVIVDASRIPLCQRAHEGRPGPGRGNQSLVEACDVVVWRDFRLQITSFGVKLLGKNKKHTWICHFFFPSWVRISRHLSVNVSWCGFLLF